MPAGRHHSSPHAPLNVGLPAGSNRWSTPRHCPPCRRGRTHWAGMRRPVSCRCVHLGAMSATGTRRFTRSPSAADWGETHPPDIDGSLNSPTRRLFPLCLARQHLARPIRVGLGIPVVHLCDGMRPDYHATTEIMPGRAGSRATRRPSPHQWPSRPSPAPHPSELGPQRGSRRPPRTPVGGSPPAAS
jgi:hypothetical protein